MAKLRINGDSSGYVDLEAPNAASSSTLDLDQVPQKNAANVFTTAQTIQNDNAFYAANITESSNAAIALRVTPTRAGQTKGISLGAIGKNGSLSTGIQAYDTSDNSSNTLELNPHGGAVTAPGQPAFWATSSTYATTGNYPFTNFNISGAGRFNTGSHLNLTSGVFTAPLAGKYQFNGAFHSNSASSTARRIGRFQLNGNSLGEFAESSAQYVDIGASIIVNMSANDTMQIITHPLNFDGVDFSGFLIG